MEECADYYPPISCKNRRNHWPSYGETWWMCLWDIDRIDSKRSVKHSKSTTRKTKIPRPVTWSDFTNVKACTFSRATLFVPSVVWSTISTTAPCVLNNWNLLKQGHYQQTSLGRSLRALYGQSKLSDNKAWLFRFTILKATHCIQHKNKVKRPSLLYITSTLSWMRRTCRLVKNIKLKPPSTRLGHRLSTFYDAVMASTAAPTYFPCFPFQMKENKPDKTIAGIDGSIFDNPCISYGSPQATYSCWQGSHHHCVRHRLLQPLYRKEDWNCFGSLGVVDPSNDMPLD